MASKPVSIATRDFKSQSDAMTFFKAMLNRYKPGDRVAGVDAFDLAALLERHAEYAEKVGVGVDHFELMMTDQAKTRYLGHFGKLFDLIYTLRATSSSRSTATRRASFRALSARPGFRPSRAIWIIVRH